MPEITTRIRYIHDAPALVPARERDLEELRAFGESGNLAVTIIPYGKTDALRDWYFGAVQLVADGLGILKDDLHTQLKVKTRFISNYALGETGPVPILRSIARTKISRPDLLAYVDAALEVLFTEYLPGVRRADVLRKIEEKYGPRPR